MTKLETLQKFLLQSLNQFALNKGGDSSQTLGDVLTLSELRRCTMNCIDYFCELSGISRDSVTVHFLNDEPKDFDIRISLTEPGDEYVE